MTVLARPRSVATTPLGGWQGLRSRIVELAAVEAGDPIARFAAARACGEDATIWLAPEGGLQLVAIGAAWSVRAAGATRFVEIARAWAELVDGAAIDGAADARGVGPLLLGGFGFADDAVTSPVWRLFESASLVLPRLLLTATEDRAWLTTNALGADGDLEAAGRLWRRLGEVPAPAGVPDEPDLRVVREVPAAPEWKTAAARLAGAVGRGRLDKVVLARRLDLEAAGAVDLAGVLRRLAASAPESTVFAIARGRRTFVGATPERLVSSEGRDFRTVALAGSTGRGIDVDEDDRLAGTLLASEKEREEHRLVVEMLRESLAPLAERLTVPLRPGVRRLRHVQHLVTEIDGRLHEPADVLSLVRLLHPTPAVGGTPRELALQLIAEQERIERGWYAGPVGWVDRHGDGEFVVGIRSGVIEGRAASLFAGCGIVADSDPAREWQESLDKLRALASALGRVTS